MGVFGKVYIECCQVCYMVVDVRAWVVFVVLVGGSEVCEGLFCLVCTCECGIGGAKCIFMGVVFL